MSVLRRPGTSDNRKLYYNLFTYSDDTDNPDGETGPTRLSQWKGISEFAIVLQQG